MESAPEPVAGEHTMRLATLALVGALAFALRAVVLVQLRDVPLFDAALGDGRAYWERAGAILAGESGHEPFYQAPLYPYFLAGLRALGAPNYYHQGGDQLSLPLGLGRALRPRPIKNMLCGQHVVTALNSYLQN